MQSSSDLSNIRFDKAPFGYRVDDVDQFVEEVAQLVEQLEAEKQELEDKLEVLALKLEEYKSEEESLRAAVLGAQRLGDSIIRDSKNKAEVLLRDATTRAERMVESTQQKMERERVALTRIQKEVADFKNRLLIMYKNHLELISAMPETIPSAEKAPATEVTKDEPEAPEQAPPAETSIDSPSPTPVEEPQPVRTSPKFGELLFGDDFSPS